MSSLESTRRRVAATGLVVVALLFSLTGCRSVYRVPQVDRPFTFGVVADVQYGDKDDSGARDYRTSLQRFEQCVGDFNTRKPAFVVQLGDIVDGHRDSVEKSTNDLARVLAVAATLDMPLYHTVGNHCMAAGAENLHAKLGLDRFYYDFARPEAAGWRFVVLDGNDGGYGVMGPEQLTWFSATLAKAAKAGERVICFCHFAVFGNAGGRSQMATPEPVLDALDAAGCVVAWFAGHNHAGGYGLRNRVHHVTLKGMIEAPVKNAYALIEVFPEHIREIGFGAEPSRDLPSALPESAATLP